MDETQIRTLEDIRRFLAGMAETSLKLEGDKDDLYRWIEHTLVRFRYMWLGRKGRGLVLRYIERLSGYSRQQVTRLARQYRKTGRLRRHQRSTNGFATKYTRGDIARLADISVSHLYNLRHGKVYRGCRRTFTKTRSVKVQIGERCKPRHSNDNALAESKNSAVVRNTFGYSHVAQKHAELVNAFNMKSLNPCINFHRPCHFPTIETDAKGKQRKRYRQQDMKTPYGKLASLPGAERYLRDDVTFEQLERIANQHTDLEAWEQMQQARGQLFDTIFGQPPRAA